MQSDQSFLSTWRNFAYLAIQNVPSKDSDQPARMCRLIWIFAGLTCPKVSDVEAEIFFTPYLPSTFGHLNSLPTCPKIWTSAFYNLFSSDLSKTNAQILIRHNILWHLIWVYIVCSVQMPRENVAGTIIYRHRTCFQPKVVDIFLIFSWAYNSHGVGTH